MNIKELLDCATPLIVSDYHLKEGEAEFTKEFSADMKLACLNRVRQYAAAWERMQKARANSAHLERQPEREQEGIKRMQGILGE